ncbi:hypothetical protein [Lactococcus sp.]|uniref:hypothetical protein n=1 Tax=Lactococcus sp. TaxID=44273 RepID=UPI0035B229E2
MKKKSLSIGVIVFIAGLVGSLVSIVEPLSTSNNTITLAITELYQSTGIITSNSLILPILSCIALFIGYLLVRVLDK